ncbi:MAG: helix-turn-helix transcriptional regulator [Flexilinea sp.]|nr:helix-turn-helix transcriptional regulator [Flexilinea sp.]
MKSEEIEINTETPIHEDVVRKALSEQPAEELLADLADLFKNFSDTTRIRILSLLIDNEMCVCDIAAALGATQSAVSHQLRILKQSRLVRYRRQGKVIYYALADEHVKTIIAMGMEHITE